MATHTTKHESTDVYDDKREEDAAAAAVEVVSIVAHHSTAERGPSWPGYGGIAASTSCPCPTGLGGDWCGVFGGGGDTVVWGGWGVRQRKLACCLQD